MKMMRNSVILLVSLWVAPLFFELRAQDDTIVFTYEDFVGIVKAHHPLALSADLKLYEGEAKVLYARGAFDPKVVSDYAQKQFDGKQYYDKFNAGLKIPTWFGIEIQGGFENNNGVFLNPEQNTPSGGLIYGGISVSLGKGLFIDERRAELKKAKLYQQITEAERKLLLNDLIFEASLAYWDWFRAYHTMKVYENGYRLAKQRLDAVKEMAMIGERPFIDTVEAAIQVQNRMLLMQEGRMNYLNASARLSVYLWNEGVIPLELTFRHIPVGLESSPGNGVADLLAAGREQLVQDHPALQIGRLKIGQIEIDKKWQMEQLKPVINLKYNPLLSTVGAQPVPGQYTFGFDFSMPLFIRKERGNLRLMDVRLQRSELLLAQKRATINYKVTAALNQWATTRDQARIYTQTVKNYAELLEAERQMFDTGESSLFMINSREMGYINAQVKLIELLTKNRQAGLKARYSLAGLQ